MGYKDLTLEKIAEVMKELMEKPQFKKQWEDNSVRELSKEEIGDVKRVLGNWCMDGLGERIFRLPGGVLTGIGGVELFNKASKDSIGK